MDNVNNNHSSCEDSLYSTDLKSSSNSHQQPQKLSSPHRKRAMSFLFSISKRLGRRSARRELVYTSQEDLRSSSTDSFSLSFDRGSSSEKHIHGSSVDLTSDGHSSRTSSGSDSPPMSSSGNDENHLDVPRCHTFQHRPHRHSYESTCYRSVSALGEHGGNSNSSSNSNSGSDSDSEADNNRGSDKREAAHATVYKFSARSPLKGLHLNRLSMSTVSRVLQHISPSSSSSSSTASTRSLSCNSTPLKRGQQQNKKDKVKSDAAKKPAKPQPQQQRILRQPINYVYLKGMSGLPTRRVPRSSLCCSYGYR